MRNETKGTRKSCDKHIHVSNRGDVDVANSSCETHCAMMQVALDTEVMATQGSMMFPLFMGNQATQRVHVWRTSMQCRRPSKKKNEDSDDTSRVDHTHTKHLNTSGGGHRNGGFR